MNIFAENLERVVSIIDQLNLKAADGSKVNLNQVAIEPPRDPRHGDMATNAPLVLSKQVGVNPRELAAKICEKLSEIDEFDKVDVAGPGFINIKLTQNAWGRVLHAVLKEGEHFGKNEQGKGRPVNVEYVSANPTGPLHVGHCRGAVFGDALASLLSFVGWDVTREYYTNDAGAQILTLARTAFLRYRQALGEEIGEIPPDMYPGEYLKPLGKLLVEKHGEELLKMEEQDWLPVVRREAVENMMSLIREDLELLDIRHDIFFSEQSLHEPMESGNSEIDEMVEALEKQGLVYQGKLPPPKGQLPEDWEDREQLLFRATDFGDDIDRPLRKSDGSYTYFAADVAYFRSKFNRGFAEMIYVLGADHSGYVKRLEAIGHSISNGKSAVVARVCQLVNLIRGGKVVPMSKRSGDYVTLRDVVEELGKDAVRFMLLYRKNDAVLDFDFQKVNEQSKDNPVFYVQYAHARCSSIFREVSTAMPDLKFSDTELCKSDSGLLADEGELELISKLAAWPRIVESAAQTHEPHRIAFYLYDLASSLHAHWNRGKDSPSLRIVLRDDSALTLARLALIRAVSVVLATGLAILGVNAPDEMR